MADRHAPQRATRRRKRRREQIRPIVEIPSLGSTCLWIREERRLTRNDVQDLLGFSTSHLARIERGFVPPPETLEQLISGYALTMPLASHLRELAAPAQRLDTVRSLREYISAGPGLNLQLDEYARRGILAAYVDPTTAILKCNEPFKRRLPGIEHAESLAGWVFSSSGKATIIDHDLECVRTVTALKPALGRFRTSEQARDLITRLSPDNDVRRIWASSTEVSAGRDSTSLLHARNPIGTPTSYRLNIGAASHTHNIQLLTAVPERYVGSRISA